MSQIPINGNRLSVARGGEGEPVVIVHGSWTGHAVWRGVANELRSAYDVTTYDRLGHADSDRPDIAHTRRRHEDDLIALIEHVDAGPVHVIGSSYGGATTLAVAMRRPDLVRSVIVHEPALVDAAPTPGTLAAKDGCARVAQRIRDGEVAEGTKAFFEELALGPGGWDLLPDVFRELALSNAPTFASEQTDPDWGAIDLDALAAYPGRVVLTGGDQGPAWFAPILDALEAAIPSATRITIEGAGHSPHATHPAAYTALLAEQLSRGGAPSAGGSLRASA